MKCAEKSEIAKRLFQYAARRRCERKWPCHSAVIWRQKLCHDDLQLWSSWQSNKALRPAGPLRGRREHNSRQQTQAGNKVLVKWEHAARHLKASCRAEGSLPEGTYTCSYTKYQCGWLQKLDFIKRRCFFVMRKRQAKHI